VWWTLGIRHDTHASLKTC